MSNGGRIALDFTVQHPERVERLVLVATGVHGYETVPEEDKVWEEFGRKMKPQEDLVREGRTREAVEMDVDAWAPAQNPRSREHILTIALDNSHILSNHPGKLQVSPDPPAFKRLSEIRVPTLLMIGDRDVEGMRMIMDRLHGVIAGSKKVGNRGRGPHSERFQTRRVQPSALRLSSLELPVEQDQEKPGKSQFRIPKIADSS